VGNLKSVWTAVNGWCLYARTIAPVSNREQTPVLVLIHGLLISSRYMVPTAAQLGQTYPVYALDLPGFGKSGDPAHVLTLEELSDVIVAWLDVMHLPQAIFLGNSLGAQILIDLAARYPERVDRLILIGPTVDPQARTVVQQASRLLIDFVYEKPSLFYHLLIDCWRAGIWRTWQTFQYALQDYTEEKLSAIQAPTLVVRGDRDLVAPQRWLERITAQLPNGRFYVIPKGPHCVNYTTPGALAQVVHTFIQESTKTPTLSS
jgi:2-hydroxy-6-oxonona-2,4-dienedioate hydrolase